MCVNCNSEFGIIRRVADNMDTKIVVRRECGFRTVQGKFIKYTKPDGSGAMYFEPEIEEKAACV